MPRYLRVRLEDLLPVAEREREGLFRAVEVDRREVGRGQPPTQARVERELAVVAGRRAAVCGVERAERPVLALDDAAQELHRSARVALTEVLDGDDPLARHERGLNPHVSGRGEVVVAGGVPDQDVPGGREDAEHVLRVLVGALRAYDVPVPVTVEMTLAGLVLVDEVAGDAGAPGRDDRDLREGGQGRTSRHRVVRVHPAGAPESLDVVVGVDEAVERLRLHVPGVYGSGLDPLESSALRYAPHSL